MPNRIIRAELLDSEPWLSLKDNVDRTAWIACFLTVDNFGNMPAGPHRLVKLWRPYGIDNPEKAAKVLADLADVDLIRRYEADGKPYLHIPRFRQDCRWIGSFWPLSPWTTSEQKQKIEQKTPVDSCGHMGKLDDVDVDLDVDVSKNKSKTKSKSVAPIASRLAPDWQLPEDWKAWAVRAHHLDPQKVVRIALAFRDYWIAKPKDAAKLDWLATWRNWIRREVERA